VPATSDRRPGRVDCVGAIVHDPLGRLLLVQRANPPAAGTWSIPGGRVEPGEDDATAITREVAEETGLAVRVGELVGQVERDAPDGRIYVIRDYVCTLEAGPADGVADRPVAADDASDARWVDLADLGTLPLAPLLLEPLEQWRMLPLR